MPVVLGVFVAMSYGSADFLGGHASQRASTLSVLFVGQLVAVTVALIVACAVGARVTAADMEFGAAAGVTNVIGLGLLYQGLARAGSVWSRP